MSEVLQQENAIILAVAEKLVSLGSEISQDLIEGKESKVKEKKWIKIFTLLTAYRKRATYSDDQLESILYDLRLLSEESVFPTVSPLVGQPIDYNINNGDNEVIGYASLASFPATGEDDTIYIDRSTDTLYRWDTVTEAYISVGGGGTTYFLGVYASLGALQTAYPTANPGEYAYVDTGVGDDIVIYIWDDDDAQWVLSAGVPFSLTNGNGTTANGTAVDLGGTLASPVNIDGAQPVVFGGTTPLSAMSSYVQVGDRILTIERDAGIINIDAQDVVQERGGYFYPGDYDGSGDMGVEVGAYSALNIIKFSINALIGIVSLISDYASSVFNFVGVTLNLAKGADIASANTTDIGAATGNYVDVTGTTTITGLGTVQAGAKRTVTFTNILTLTHNATSLILPTGANITTEAGDVAEFVSLGSGNWKCVSYQRASGAPLSGATTGSVSIDPVSFDGMGAVILAGTKRYIRAKFAGTITGWSIIADGSSPTCELDIKKIATGTALPSSSIVASDPPDLTTGNAVDSTSLTGWTTSIAAGDILEISVTAATVMTKMEFALRVS